MITKTTITTASDLTAWKTASMKGYLFKSVAKGDGATGFWLVFVPAGAGTITINSSTGAVTASSGTITCFKFNSDGTLASWSSGGDNNNVEVDLGAELLGHIINSSWQTSTQSDFEASRSGGGEW